MSNIANELFIETRKQTFDEAVSIGDHANALAQIHLLRQEGFTSEAADLEGELLFPTDDSWDY